ncbi:MAG: KamA family radical SAM protein [Ignavibacteria bacterium]|nr:KamA family radical SAM protein [Ignavibacteria bacterium]MBK9333303.1 KamA family radical SAM protein [Ignavibacteria bacterium]
MELWQEMIRNSVSSVDHLVEKFSIERETAEKLDEFFQARINPYYLSLIRYPGDPIWLQCVPDIAELEDIDSQEDPLNEDDMSPVPNITHRYPDRALFLVTSQCGLYCRFCTRKRKVGDQSKISMRTLESAFQYLESHPEINDVILSGGDPLMLTDNMLEKIIFRLRQIKHIQIIRLGTKMPCVLPHRITPQLCEMLRKYHPIYVNTHFNHPWELTDESKRACAMLADAGIPVGNQCVLMKGVNDNADVMKDLMKGLLAMRVRPYYIYQADLTKGANHFRTPLKVGLEIMDKLRGHISGLAVPHFVVDAPGGGGKIPLLPDYVISRDDEKIVLRNFKYNIYEYPEINGDSNSNNADLFMRRKKIRRRTVNKKDKIRKINIPVLNNS